MVSYIMYLMSHRKQHPLKNRLQHFDFTSRALYASCQFYSIVFSSGLIQLDWYMLLYFSIRLHQFIIMVILLLLLLLILSHQPIDDRSVYNLLNKYNRKINWFINLAHWLNSWCYQTHIIGCVTPQSFNSSDSINVKRWRKTIRRWTKNTNLAKENVYTKFWENT